MCDCPFHEKPFVFPLHETVIAPQLLHHFVFIQCTNIFIQEQHILQSTFQTSKPQTVQK